MNENPDIKEKKKTVERPSIRYSIILYNDDENTFDHVINCLMRICRHEFIQAEQCAILAHNRGHIDVASGSFDKMYEINKEKDIKNSQNSILDKFKSLFN